MDTSFSRRERLNTLLPILCCPACGQDGFHFEPETSRTNGGGQFTGDLICQRCSVPYRMDDGIVELLPHGLRGLTLAQWSGQRKVVTRLYERVWRKRALKLFSGETFPPEREFEILAHCLSSPLRTAPGTYLDLACSTGYYGRAIVDLLRARGEGQRPSVVVGLDFSLPMLKQARTLAREAGSEDYTFFIHADASCLPFADAGIAGIACGGSLNEYREAPRVLAEGARVLIPGHGRYFMMNLLEPEKPFKRFTRKTMTLGSGLKFFTRQQMNTLFAASGLCVLWQEDYGLVAFTELAVAS